jgi:hypothetical protein
MYSTGTSNEKIVPKTETCAKMLFICSEAYFVQSLLIDSNRTVALATTAYSKLISHYTVRNYK